MIEVVNMRAIVASTHGSEVPDMIVMSRGLLAEVVRLGLVLAVITVHLAENAPGPSRCTVWVHARTERTRLAI